MIAYDLETTSIGLNGEEAHTPKPLYITAFSEALGISYAFEIRSLDHLRQIVETRFLISDLNRARFVGWNANNFDVYFVCAALLNSPDYILRPYLTKSKKVRGVKVVLKNDERQSWEFLDGMSMTGIQRNLKTFLEVFAPNHGKLDSPKFDQEQFNPRDSKHREYAMRDSVGLWHGLQRAEEIVKGIFKIGLQPTIGNLGIKLFQENMPRDVVVWPLDHGALDVVRSYLMRGGFCYCVGKYHGPVWKYDINQAYAAAMRDCWLPAGRCARTKAFIRNAKAAMYCINARAPRGNIVPFYWRDSTKKARYDFDNLRDAWVTQSEFLQLQSEGWKIEILAGYFWNDHFRMREYVAMLEDLRINGPGGPKSAQGEMIKAIGNNSYGKTVEQLGGLELIMARECPDGFARYQDEDDLFQHLWFKFTDPPIKAYHQPQIGAFITAHVRMVMRQTILKAPRAWLYGDTDGLMFSEPIDLDLSNTRYGAWKLEAEGEIYRIITKKVYANDDASEKHAKGMNINRLNNDDFINWFNGAPPEQIQTHRVNIIKVMTGDEMFHRHKKVGQRIAKNS